MDDIVLCNDNIHRVTVTKPSLPPLDEYVEELRSIWLSKCLTNYGPVSEQYASMLRDYLGCPDVFLTANGHLGLEVALDCLRLSLEPATEKREVVTTPYTAPSTVNAIVRRGFEPVFCDVRESDCTLDPDLLSDLVGPSTAAIMPVHVYGIPCDVEAIADIASGNGVPVIYDAAHTFGVKKGGVPIASFGNGSLFSTHATKAFHTVEGGVFASNDPKLFEPYGRLVNFGFDTPDNVTEIGTNARMNELEAAMGVCNLRHFEDELARRKIIAEIYFDRLAGVRGIKTLHIPSDVEWNYSYFPVFLDGFERTRDEVKANLEAHNIYPRKYFWPLVCDLACYAPTYGRAHVPVARRASQNVLALPLYADLDPSDANLICDLIVKA